MQLEGVQGVHEQHFWTLCSNYYCGGLKLEVLPDCDPKYIISHTQNIFRGVNVTQLYIQLDYENHQNGGAGIQGYSASQASSWTQPSSASASAWGAPAAASTVPMGYNPQSMGQNLLLQPPGGYNQYQMPSPASTGGCDGGGGHGHSHDGGHGHSHQGKQW